MGGLVALVAGCGKNQSQTAAPPPADVQVATVTQQDVPVTREWVGVLDGSVNAEIRAQVSGYLVKQTYKEGAAVHQGDPLFEIDPRPLAAALSMVEGQLGQAEAQVAKNQADVKRYTPLAKSNAISQEQLEDSVQAERVAEAQIVSARAAVDQAKLNLGFTAVVSPIDGVAGLARAQIGDLVGPGSGALTTVSTVDPIKAYFPISEQSYLEFRNRDADSTSLPSDLEFELVLSNGSTYPIKGKLYAVDRQVDGNTGTIRVAALFPNPKNLLRPGQYARIRAVVSTARQAFLVPSRALTELQGSYQLVTVDGEKKAHIVTVKTGSQLGSQTVVESGLHPGDRIVVEGLQKVREGAVVNPLPYSATPAAK